MAVHAGGSFVLLFNHKLHGNACFTGCTRNGTPPETSRYILHVRLTRRRAVPPTHHHDPLPLQYQFKADRPHCFNWEYVATGPDVWQVRQNPTAATVLKKLNIDFCGKGNRLFADVCAEAGLDPNAVKCRGLPRQQHYPYPAPVMYRIRYSTGTKLKRGLRSGWANFVMDSSYGTPIPQAAPITKPVSTSVLKCFPACIRLTPTQRGGMVATVKIPIRFLPRLW